MPRRAKRFSFLNKALKLVGGAPTSGVLADYLAFKVGATKITQGPVPSTARQSVGYAIIPFGRNYPPAAVGASHFYKTRLSVFSNEWRTSNGFNNASLGYNTGLYAQAPSSGGFHPAVIKVFVATGPAANKLSAITKQTYKKTPGHKYSMPFGCNLTNAALRSEFAQQAALTGIVSSLTSAKSISFLPEQLSKIIPEPMAGQ